MYKTPQAFWFSMFHTPSEAGLQRVSSSYLAGEGGVEGPAVLQEGRCFHVLTKAVGMREYGTVVMLFHASSVGS